MRYAIGRQGNGKRQRARALEGLAGLLVFAAMGACSGAQPAAQEPAPDAAPNGGDAGIDAVSTADAAHDSAGSDDAAADAPQHPTGAIKFHPGHYLWDYTDKWRTSEQQGFSDTVAFIKNDPNFQGIELQLAWYYLEGPTEGDYTPLTTTIASALAQLAAIGKHLALNVVVVSPYNGFSPLYPKYMTDNGWVVTIPSGGQVPDMGNPKAMAALTSLGKAVAAQFDSSPNFEWFCPWYDLSIGAPQWQSSHGQDTYYNALAGLFGALAPAFEHTLVRVMSSFTGYPNEMWQLFSYLRKFGNVLYGGTDPDGPSATSPFSWGGQAFVGADVGGTADPNGFGSMVGKYPYVTQWEGYLNDHTVGGSNLAPADLAAYAETAMGAYYIVWNHQVSDTSSPSITSPLGSPNFGFSSHVRPYVDSVKGNTRPGVPSVGSWNTQ
jgi:hypothetical protein